MAIEAGGIGPYAPPTAVRAVIERYRDRGLQVPFTADVLQRAGISESLTNRTMAALRLLDLIDEEGQPQEAMNVLRSVRQEDFQERLRIVLQNAYASIFAFVDPATASEDEVRDAFRSNTPHGRQARMVTLFLGLCEWAGIRPPSGRERAERPVRQPRVPDRPASRGATPRRPARTHARAPVSNIAARLDELPAPLIGLLTELPPVGGSWSKVKREGFVAAFGVVLDLCYVVQPDEPKKEAGGLQ